MYEREDGINKYSIVNLHCTLRHEAWTGHLKQDIHKLEA